MKNKHGKTPPRMCLDCRNDYYNKPKNIVKICVDCGTEFVCSVFATMKVRCDECQNIINKKRKSARNTRYYSFHKN